MSLLFFGDILVEIKRAVFRRFGYFESDRVDFFFYFFVYRNLFKNVYSSWRLRSSSRLVI